MRMVVGDGPAMSWTTCPGRRSEQTPAPMQFGVGRRFLETPPSATGVDNGWADTAPWWTMAALFQGSQNL